MKYTHVKRPYRAACLQYDGTNGDQVIALLEESGAKCERKPCGNYILVRWTDGREDESVHAIGNGWWVRRGENGITKCYDDETFNERYVELPEEEGVAMRGGGRIRWMEITDGKLEGLGMESSEEWGPTLRHDTIPESLG